jgi:hypothetical protein
MTGGSEVKVDGALRSLTGGVEATGPEEEGAQVADRYVQFASAMLLRRVKMRLNSKPLRIQQRLNFLW